MQLVEVTHDSEIGMICAGYVCIASFSDRQAFDEAHDFKPPLPPPYRATSGVTFDIWADDPQFKEDR